MGEAAPLTWTKPSSPFARKPGLQHYAGQAYCVFTFSRSPKHVVSCDQSIKQRQAVSTLSELLSGLFLSHHVVGLWWCPRCIILVSRFVLFETRVLGNQFVVQSAHCTHQEWVLPMHLPSSKSSSPSSPVILLLQPLYQ